MIKHVIHRSSYFDDFVLFVPTSSKIKKFYNLFCVPGVYKVYKIQTLVNAKFSKSKKSITLPHDNITLILKFQGKTNS